MPGSKPAILLVQPHLGFLRRVLEPDFTVWALWEGPPVEAVDRDPRPGGRRGISRSTRRWRRACRSSGLIACLTAGYDGVDLAWASRRADFMVSHSPGVNVEDVADHALGLILAAWRRIAEGDRAVRAGLWRANEKMLTPSLTAAGAWESSGWARSARRRPAGGAFRPGR